MRRSSWLALGALLWPLAPTDALAKRADDPATGAESDSAAAMPNDAGLLRLDPPVAPGSLAPRLLRLGEERMVLTWLERLEKGHRLRHAVLENGRFGPARTIAEGSFFANWADTPGLTVTPDGAWVAHWLERSGSGTYAYDVRVAISHDEGATWGEPFTAHRDGTKTEHGFVSHYPDADGAGLAWLDGRNTAPAPADRPPGNERHEGHEGHERHEEHHPSAEDGSMTLRTAVITSDGTLSREAELDVRVCDCCATAAARTDEGPIVVYRDRSETEVRDISIVRRQGDRWSAPVTVHADGWRIEGCPVNGPAVLADGQVVIVAWFTLGDDNTPRVHLARSTDGGRRFDEPLTFDHGHAIGRVDLAWDGTGFYLSWMAGNPAARQSGARLRLARFDGSGHLLRSEDLVRLPGQRGNGFPRLTIGPGGDVLLAWTEGTPQGSLIRVARVPAWR